MPELRIGVWNTAFLGDAVLTLPLLQNLRAAYPEASIHFWVRKGLAPLFAAHPAVTRAHEHDKRGAAKNWASGLRLGAAIAAARHDIWISAHTSLRSGFFALRSGAAMRIGYDAPWFNACLYTHTVPRCFDSLEEIERLLLLLRPLHIPVTEFWPEIALPAAVNEKSGDILGRLAPYRRGAPVLGVHPGSVWATKRWLPASFAALAAQAARQGAGVVLFAGPGEEAVALEVKEKIFAALGPAGKEMLLDLSGALSLPELAACIGRVSCYVTNDSGPMHLAWAQRVPVTAIFGPTTRQLGFFPRGAGASVIEAALPCRPCGLHGPRQCPEGHHRCMGDIDPEMVWADVSGKLFGGRSGRRTA